MRAKIIPSRMQLLLPSLLVVPLFPLLALSQARSAQSRVADRRIASSQVAKPPATAEPLATLEKHLSALEAGQATSSADLQARLDRLEKGIADVKRPSLFATLSPALIAAVAGLTGVLLGGLINQRLQTRLVEKQARFQIGNAVVEWQLKQLSLLYGPLRAFLGQSFGLYRQMNKVLEAVDSSRFRFAQVGGTLDGQQFQIQTSPGNWERFGTVIHISQVYGKGFGVETYFDEIVSIGERIVAIIEQHAGYARPQERELATVFGRYLAHFAVLKHLHAEAKRRLFQTDAKAEPTMKIDLSAVFPVELHDLVNSGFQAITNDIGEWRTKAGA